MPLPSASQTFHLRHRNETPVCSVPFCADPATAIPAAKRVEADPEPPRRLGCRKELPRHDLGNLPHIIEAEMFFRQVLHEDLGCASYVVADGGVAAVIDPK